MGMMLMLAACGGGASSRPPATTTTTTATAETAETAATSVAEPAPPPEEAEEPPDPELERRCGDVAAKAAPLEMKRHGKVVAKAKRRAVEATLRADIEATCKATFWYPQALDCYSVVKSARTLEACGDTLESDQWQGYVTVLRTAFGSKEFPESDPCEGDF